MYNTIFLNYWIQSDEIYIGKKRPCINVKKDRSSLKLYGKFEAITLLKNIYLKSCILPLH